MSRQLVKFEDKVAFAWKIADKLRGHFKTQENGQVIQPLLVLRRLDCVLEPTREAGRKRDQQLGDRPDAAKAPLLRQAAGQEFYNTSPLHRPGMLAVTPPRATDLSALPIASGMMHRPADQLQVPPSEGDQFADLLDELIVRFLSPGGIAPRRQRGRHE